LAIIDRSELQGPVPTGQSGLIPIEYSMSIIQQALASSMVLNTFRRITMPTGVQNLPVLDVLPSAQWVSGEVSDATPTAGEKPTTEQKWKGIVLNAEELAAIVVIPEAVLEDAAIDLWAEITPRLAESIGRALDLACFAGTNKPASWPTAIIPAATAAGNVAVGTDMDVYNEAFGKVEADGYMPEQVYASLAERSAFRGWTASGVPVYLSDLRSDGRVDEVMGINIAYDRFGALGASRAVVGDPTMAILGVRTDMQFKVLTEATIDTSAALDGSKLVNLAQQDSRALRVRARFAFQVANPVTYQQAVAANRYPFAVVNAA
jgi:HK97 family phage major capsid protein